MIRCGSGNVSYNDEEILIANDIYTTEYVVTCMNVTEQKAYNWLMNEYNYKQTDLIFQRRRTPDFITSDGKGYEVKLAYGHSNTVWFSKAQFDFIKKTPCEIIIFNNIQTTPISIFSSETLRPGVVCGMRIIVGEDMKNKRMVEVLLTGGWLKRFEKLKEKLKFKNDTEVLRHAIVFTEKRTK